MYADIVFPRGNEEEFIEIAEKLGYSAIIFAYGKTDKLPESMPNSKLKIFTAIVCEEKEIQKAKNKADIVLVKSTGNDRWVLEKSKADVLFGLEEVHRKDFMHHRASGLNQVLCRIAAKKGKKIGLSFSSVLNSGSMLRAQIMGKMMQNIRFCRKFKVGMVIASFAKKPYEMRSPGELMAFGISLGMHPKEAKDSMSWTK
jgi:RNase P/RNase MRP subunit p30